MFVSGGSAGPGAGTRISARDEGLRAMAERERLTDRLTDELRDVASQISQLQARQAELIARLEDEGCVGTTMTRWVGWQAGLAPGEARVAVRVSRCVRDLPVIASAFREGRLSQGVVSSLVSVATPDNEAELVETSKVATGSQLTRLVRVMRRIIADDDRSATADEHLWLTSRDDGMWDLRGLLRAEVGSKLASAIRAAQDLERDGDGSLVSAHEAIERVADGFLDTCATAGSSIPERYQVVVRADLDDLGDIDAHIVDTGHIEPHKLSELLCESYLSIVYERDAKPVAVADVRLATPAQRKALLVRDGGCRFPGCGRTRFLKAHHLIHRSDGGPTSIDNMVLLCQAHHSKVHEPGWKVGFDDDGHLAFIDPGGTDRARPPGRPVCSSDPPPPGPRHTGTGERLDNFGADVIMHHWLCHRSQSNMR